MKRQTVREVGSVHEFEMSLAPLNSAQLIGGKTTVFDYVPFRSEAAC